jgi:hypothetical protein
MMQSLLGTTEVSVIDSDQQRIDTTTAGGTLSVDVEYGDFVILGTMCRGSGTLFTATNFTSSDEYIFNTLRGHALQVWAKRITSTGTFSTFVQGDNYSFDMKTVLVAFRGTKETSASSLNSPVESTTTSGTMYFYPPTVGESFSVGDMMVTIGSIDAPGYFQSSSFVGVSSPYTMYGVFGNTADDGDIAIGAIQCDGNQPTSSFSQDVSTEEWSSYIIRLEKE